MANIDELRTLAQQIKNETNAGANTANRVGTTFEKTVTELETIEGNVEDIVTEQENIEVKVTDLSGVVSRSGVPISSASLEDRIASNGVADKNHHSIRFGRVTDDAITVVGYGITGSIMGTYLDVLWSTAKHRFVAYDSRSDKYYSEWAGPYIPSSSNYTSVSSSRPEEQSTPYYDKVYIDNAGGVYAYSPSERSLVTADIDLSYLTGVSGIEMSSGGTLDMGLGSITKVDSLVMSGAGSGSISNVKHLTMYTGGELDMSGGTISGMSRIDMSGGTISEVATLSFKSGGTLAPSVIGVSEIFGKNKVHISMSGSTTDDGIDFGNAPLKNINGIVMSTGGTIRGANLSGNGYNSISGYNNITMAYSGTLDMNNSSINNANIINIGSGTLNVIGGVINASGALLQMSNASITGNINATGASLSGVAINNGIFSGSTQMGPVLISGSTESPFHQTLTVRFSEDDFGKVDMISCVLKTPGVELKSGGVLTFSDGTTMGTASQFSGTLRGTIEHTTFGSGNTFTSGFINELKAALGIS